MANLKHKSENWGVGREKWDHSSGQLSRLPRALKRELHGGDGLVLCPVGLLVHVSYDWQCVSLRWMSLNWKTWRS